MSWLKLNDSLNAIKGQISTFAQEVLAEDPETIDENDPIKKLTDANNKIQELTDLCSTQDSEVIKNT